MSAQVAYNRLGRSCGELTFPSHETRHGNENDLSKHASCHSMEPFGRSRCENGGKKLTPRFLIGHNGPN